MKVLAICAILLVALLQAVTASVFSQLQFIKIVSPASGATVQAGENMTIKYTMQPLILDHVAFGEALSLNVKFHSRSGNKKQQLLTTIAPKCPVTAKESKYVTYTRQWKVPANTKPGSYAVEFNESFRTRGGTFTATETVPHLCLKGETLSSVGYTIRGGGKGSNQSAALGRAGAKVYHAGIVGKDAVWVKDLIHDQGVDVSFIKVDEQEANGRALIQVSQENGDNCIVLYPGTNAKYTAEYAQQVLENFGPGDWILQQNEISQGGAIMNVAADKGLSVIFNPAPMTSSVLSEFPLDKVDILQVNETEATIMYQAVTGRTDEPVPEELVELLMKSYPKLQGIVMTLGGDGVLAVFRHNGQTQKYRIPVAKAIVKDTTAAGDTFVGFFLAAFLRDTQQEFFKRVEASLNEANVAAAISVERPGSMSSVPTLNEVLERSG
ncbi:Ribokinase-like protein [Umbelopsis sp. AD052]|nr:Ribokinase-like protein [Umbelopsis sp. AD052]